MSSVNDLVKLYKAKAAEKYSAGLSSREKQNVNPN